jgi:acetyltransferase AlgX (SGNH hydrolase-like protein)
MVNESRFFYRHAGLWLVPLAVLLALAMGEVLLRLFPQLLTQEAQIKRLWMLQTRVKSVGDPYLGFVYRPHYRKRVVSLDFEFGIEADEHGFRNASPWPDQADIVIVGDSMVYGFGVEEGNSWVGKLAGQLPVSGIISLGLPGAVPQQYYRYFERFGVGLKPKLLIFGIFPGNDVVDAVTFDRWVAAGSPDNYDVWRFFEGKIPTRKDAFPRNIQVWLLAESVKKSLGQKYSAMTVRLEGGGSLQLAPAIYKRAVEHNDPADPGFRRVVQAAVDARNLARENGSEFLVLLFPTKEEIYLPLHDEPFPSLTHNFAEVLEHEGISYIDFTGRFRELAAEGKKLYFKIDGHPNKQGNSVIADVLANHLRQQEQRLIHPGAEAE